jgi:general secretion pathway protein D
MTPPATKLQRKFLAFAIQLNSIALFVFFTGIASLAVAQQPDEGSAVTAEQGQVDAAVNGDLSTPASVAPAEGSVEKNIKDEMEAPPAEAPAAEPAANVEPPAAGAGEEDFANQAFKDAADAGVDKPAASEKPAAKKVQAVKAAKPASGGTLNNVVMEESLRRQALEAHADECLVEAEREFARRDYETAVKLFEEAKKYLGTRSGVEAKMQRVQKGLGESYYKWSLLMRRVGDLTVARQKAVRAVEERYPNAEKLVVSIDMEMKEPPPKKIDKAPLRWQDEKYKAGAEKISDLLARGRQYYMTGELDMSQDMFERVLKREPYNTEAIRQLDKVAQKKQDRATMEVTTTRNNMMATVRQTWNPRNYAITEPPETSGTTESPKISSRNESSRAKLIAKMERIIIPAIEFRQANINDVILFLQTASVEYDNTEGPEESKGVNIVLNLGEGAAPSAGAPAEAGTPFAAEGAAAAPAASSGEIVPITFSARHISLLEALKIVTEVAKLKYRVEDQVVMVVPLLAPDGEIIVRTYDVLPSFVDKVGTMSEATKPQQGALKVIRMGEGQMENDNAAHSDWKAFFAEMGVNWPEGSKIKYVSAIGKLIVANTAGNLTTFERILGELNVVPNQIEIEARFVDVQQMDLNSLGFEWLMTDNWEVASKKGQESLPLSSRQRIEVGPGTSSGEITSGLRYSKDLPIPTGGVPTPNDSVLTIASILTNPEMALVIHALEQKGEADLLSAPKVTTQSGTEATIKVVTEYIYPTQFTVTPITGVGINGVSTIVGGVVEPGGFETREVGVILKVTPEVNTEGMINLTLSPEVVTDPDWKDYGSVYTAPDGSKQTLTMQQPFFHTRSITTSISIYNGATLVMGGMITEQRTETDDKVPFLGDIPLVGRLFRSKVDQSSKRNLLIFVTARLVDPAGRPVGARTAITDRLTQGSEGSNQ